MNVVLALIVLQITYCCRTVNAQEAIVRVEVQEELSPEARILLNRIFDPYSLEATLDLNTSKRVGLLCGLGLCSERRYELPEKFQIPQANFTSLEVGEFYAIRSETDSSPDLVVFRETGQFDFPLNSKNEVEGVTILPLEERRLVEGIAVSAIEWGEAGDLNWKGAQTLTARSLRSSDGSYS